MKRILFAALLVMALAPQASAQVIRNYSVWNDMPFPQKLGYVQGLLDGIFDVAADGEPARAARAIGLSRCFQELGIRGDFIVEAIDDHYSRDAASWAETPKQVFIHQFVNRACSSHIDDLRTQIGLEPLPTP